MKLLQITYIAVTKEYNVEELKGNCKEDKYPKIKYKNNLCTPKKRKEMDCDWSNTIKKIIMIEMFIKKNKKTRIIKGLVKNQFADVVSDVVDDGRN